jgi:23S rRNA (guanosine2251-2'-O)-methyltransferase
MKENTRGQKQLFLVLHDIRSAYNVGAIFRTADGAGVSRIYLSGYTSCPADGAKEHKTKADKMIEKTALGAEKAVAWEKCDDLEKLLEKLKKDNCAVVALEKTGEGIALEKFKAAFPMALILGNEVEGIAEKILEKCDAVVSIPMRGQKESLNVSVAAGIAIYEFLK